MALLLATNVEPQEIAQTYHCHATTVYRIKQNVDIFGEARPAPVLVQSRPLSGLRGLCGLRFIERTKRFAGSAAFFKLFNA
jgi:hypothetical protein